MPMRSVLAVARCGSTSLSSASAAARLEACRDSTSVMALLSARLSPVLSAAASARGELTMLLHCRLEACRDSTSATALLSARPASFFSVVVRARALSKMLPHRQMAACRCSTSATGLHRAKLRPARPASRRGGIFRRLRDRVKKKNRLCLRNKTVVGKVGGD